MITTRTARQCGQADYGWLQARYTFSFGHYFDPKLLGYASLRVLNLKAYNCTVDRSIKASDHYPIWCHISKR